MLICKQGYAEVNDFIAPKLPLIVAEFDGGSEIRLPQRLVRADFTRRNRVRERLLMRNRDDDTLEPRSNRLLSGFLQANSYSPMWDHIQWIRCIDQFPFPLIQSKYQGLFPSFPVDSNGDRIFLRWNGKVRELDKDTTMNELEIRKRYKAAELVQDYVVDLKADDIVKNIQEWDLNQALK